MTSRSIEDLIGGEDETEDDVANEPIVIGESPDITQIFRGVTVTWLMQAFRMDRSTVKKRMANCQPLKYGKGNVPIYDFVQACEYLVKPKVDLDEYLKRLKPEDLPLDLRKEYWEAQLKKQRWEEKAGQLWRTEDVIEVYSEALKHIKTSTQVWASNLDRKTGLSTEQYDLLISMTDRLLSDMHQRLLEMQSHKTTPNSSDGAEDPEDV